ncbi:MAG: NADH dehydrogenase (quinone) subunit D [Chloroflexi bacterium]|nr:NADH dehydrogenase (quinone) subunit D [Chloroflexota bacterium]
MSIETTISHLRARFPNALNDISEFHGETRVTIPRDALLTVTRFLRDECEPRFQMLLDITALDWFPREPRFEVLYYLLALPSNTRIRLRVLLAGDDANVPSVTPVYTGANFYEREVYDLFGIAFTDHPFLHRILLPDYVTGHPLRKDHPLGYEPVEFTHTYDEIQPDKPSAIPPPQAQKLLGSVRGSPVEIPVGLPDPQTPWSAEDSDTLLINMGPHHPSTHGVLRVALEVDGERIVNALPDIGYLHTGIEKTAENKTYLKAIPLFDRMDYLGVFFNNLTYVLAVEKLMEVDVPERAQIARVILCELQRVTSHLIAVGSQAMDIGAVTVMTYAFRERESALDIFEMVSGARMMTSYFRFGGLALDLPAGFSDAVREYIKTIPPRLKEYEDLLNKNPIWLERTRGIAEYTQEDALAYSVTGPMLRATGVNWDLRKAAPYMGYEQYEFDVPVSTRAKADVLECYYIRMEEIRQSLRIIEQALDKLAKTKGQPHVTNNRKVAPPPKQELQTSMESLIHHFKLWTEGFKPPVGYAYAAVESPRGELGMLVSSNGSNMPHRVRVRTPSFANLQILPLISKGYYIADLVGIIAMTDIILGDVDR